MPVKSCKNEVGLKCGAPFPAFGVRTLSLLTPPQAGRGEVRTQPTPKRSRPPEKPLASERRSKSRAAFVLAIFRPPHKGEVQITPWSRPDSAPGRGDAEADTPPGWRRACGRHGRWRAAAKLSCQIPL